MYNTPTPHLAQFSLVAPPNSWTSWKTGSSSAVGRKGKRGWGHTAMHLLHNQSRAFDAVGYSLLEPSLSPWDQPRQCLQSSVSPRAHVTCNEFKHMCDDLNLYSFFSPPNFPSSYFPFIFSCAWFFLASEFFPPPLSVAIFCRFLHIFFDSIVHYEQFPNTHTH